MVEERGTVVGRGHRVADRFVVEAVAGRGASGTVYRALDLASNEVVALKLVGIQRDEQDQRFAREVAALAEIDHPGVVRYVDHGTGVHDRRVRYLAMEWLEGHDLRARLRASRAGVAAAGGGGTLAEHDDGREPGQVDATRAESTIGPPLTVAEVLGLARGVSEALACVHNAGVVHRDIKPSNILLQDGDPGRPKLVDFGVARLTQGVPDLALTKTGAFVGTPLYMSPEQARTEGDITPATDVWSLGAVIYECLAGVAPFSGKHFSAVLARILLEEPASLVAVTPDLPLSFEQAIMRMLRKEVEGRPADGARLVELLAQVGEVAAATGQGRADSTATTASRSGSHVLTTDERRVNCVLFARLGHASSLDVTRADAPADPTADPIDSSGLGDVTEAGAARPRADSFDRVRRHGRLDVLADGTLMLVPHAKNPKDQAIEAARAVLALGTADPDAAAFIAMGRSESATHAGVGELLDHAVGTLGRMQPGDLVVDAAVARLVEGRFVLEPAGNNHALRRELEAEERRLLLGRPTRVVGRRRELGLLGATWEEVVEDQVARCVLISAPAGAGKSRLRWEFERLVEREGSSVARVVGHGDSLSAGSPFGLIAPAVRRWFDIAEGEAPASRRAKVLDHCAPLFGRDPSGRRTALFLGELVDARFDAALDPALAAARKDPMLRGQNMGEAFVAWLAALTRREPVLVVLEDLHWGDRPSIQFLDQALRILDDAPLMVMATARPEVREVFPDLWKGRSLHTLELDPLTRRACTQLVDQVLGDEVDANIRDAIVARCDGNALYLEELIRAAAQGDGAGTPETVLGMVEARLDGLGSGPKQVLKAAAVFGEVFWAQGVTNLLRGAVASADVQAWLDELAESEVVRRQPVSQLPGQSQFRFHHALVRDAAYSTMLPGDAAVAHLTAARWLVEAGASDALSLAGHFDRGKAPNEAATWYGRAAHQALEGGDLVGARERATRALVLCTQSESRGELLALESVAAYWQSDYEGARRAGLASLDELTPGTGTWFIASGSALVSSARLADEATVAQLFSKITTTPAASDAASERVIALCRGAFQLVFACRFDDADPVLSQIAVQLDSGAEIDALTRAQAHHVQGVRAAHVGDVATFLHHLERAVVAFETAGDRRNVALERTTVAWCHAELGNLRIAERLCRGNLAHCLEIKATQAITYAKVNLGYILSLLGDESREEARDVLLDAIDSCRSVGNQRLEGWARAHLSAVEHFVGAHDVEFAHADAAVTLLDGTPGLRAWAMAARARARHALGEGEGALSDATAAMEVLRRLGGILQGESLPPLIHAKILAELDRERARAAATWARDRLRERARRLGNSEWQASFLALPDNKQTLELDV